MGDTDQPPHTQGPTVLVVEDDESLRFALDEGLSASGFRVSVVEDAEAAFEATERLRPDLVVLDWILPGGGGLMVCRRILDIHPAAKVVVFTGLDDPRDRQAARSAGARDFIQKGVPLETLTERLRELAAD